MKILVQVAILLFCVGQAFANPFLMCDPPPVEEQIVAYQVKGYTANPEEIITTPAIADGSIDMDLADAKIGISNLLVAACPPESSGVACSDDAPFTMERHAAPSPPVLRLIK